MQTTIHALKGIQTHDPSVRASEEISALDRAATVMGKVFIKDSKYMGHE
jgi:hypothetical protein